MRGLRCSIIAFILMLGGLFRRGGWGDWGRGLMRSWVGWDGMEWNVEGIYWWVDGLFYLWEGQKKGEHDDVLMDLFLVLLFLHIP